MRDIFIDKVAAEAHYMAMSHEYTEADYRNDAPPRAFGSETELTPSNTSDSLLQRLSSRDFVRDLPFYLASARSQGESIALRNGGEIYVELQRLLEYATPECSSPEELTTYERAGEEATIRIVRAIGRHVLQDENALRLFKRTGYATLYDKTNTKILDKKSTGPHENYATKIFDTGINGHVFSRPSLPVEHQQLTSYLVTRPIWSGTGMIEQDEYVISQKHQMINYLSYGVLTDDGEKSPMRFQDNRLEIRSGEANMSEWAITMKFALTSLVLRLVEHGKFPESLLLADPNTSSDLIAQNPDAKIPLASGEWVTAIEHQARIIETAHTTLSPANHIHAYEERATNEFTAFKHDFSNTYMKAGEVTAIADRVDWATKLFYITKKGAPIQDINGTNMDAVALDLSYERLDLPSYARKVHRVLGQTAINQTDIDRALLHPPQTRAARRVKVIEDMLEKGIYHYSDWQKVTSQGSKSIDLGEAL